MDATDLALQIIHATQGNPKRANEAAALIDATRPIIPHHPGEREALIEALTKARTVLASALKTAAPDFFETANDIKQHRTIAKIDAALALAKTEA